MAAFWVSGAMREHEYRLLPPLSALSGQPIHEGIEEQARESSSATAFSRCSSEPLIRPGKHPRPELWEWWGTSATVEFMEQPISRRDCRWIVFPVLGILLVVFDLQVGRPPTVFAVVDVALVFALALIGRAGPTRRWPDVAAVTLLAAHAGCQDVVLASECGTANGAATGALMLIALSAAGVNVGAQAALFLFSSVARPLTGGWSLEEAAAAVTAGLLTFCLGVAIERRSVAVFLELQDDALAASWQAQTKLETLEVRFEGLQAEKRAMAAIPDPPPARPVRAELELAGPMTPLVEATPVPRAVPRTSFDGSASVASSLGYSASGASSAVASPMEQQSMPKGPSQRTIGSPFDANASNASRGSGTFASGASSKESKLTCNIMLVDESKQERKPSTGSPEALQNALQQLAKQRGGTSGTSGGNSEISVQAYVDATAQTEPPPVHDVAIETTIADGWEKEGVLCRRCGLPPSLPKTPSNNQWALNRSSESGPRPASDSRSSSSSRRSSRRSRAPSDPAMGDDGFRALVAAGADPFVSAFQLTEAVSFNLTLEWAIKHWNLPRTPGTCCPFHFHVFVARQVLKYESRSVCDPLWSALTGWQCSTCSCLNHADRAVCDMCCEVRGESQSADVSQSKMSQSCETRGDVSADVSQSKLSTKSADSKPT